MTVRSAHPVVALLLTLAFLAAPLLPIATHRAHAFGGVTPDPVVEVGPSLLKNTITSIKSTITAISTATSAVADVAMQINAYVLQPLAFILSGQLLKMITASVISFVIGKANGTGIPQFVVDVERSLRTVRDSRALAYISGYGKHSNSPFRHSIASSLRSGYLESTSLAGFFKANQCMLERYSPDIGAYLDGDWSQGGITSWFALTLDDANNPYALYQNSREELYILTGPGVGGATGARVTELNWGQGFMSWCEPLEEGELGEVSVTAQRRDANGKVIPNEVGENPGDPCMKGDKQGKIATPGSTIKAQLDKVLGGQQDSILRMGNVGPEINKILGDVATVMQTVNLATSLLGGSNSGGLLGADRSSGGSRSRLSEFQNSAGFLGVTQSDIRQNAASLPSSGADTLARVSEFESAWNTIRTAANTASTTVRSLAKSCPAFAPVAQSALAEEISPVFAQAAAASTTIAFARMTVERVQTNLNSASADAGTSYAEDVQALQTLAPTATDVANAQEQADTLGLAVSTATSTLSVAGGTIVDRMNLITENANALTLSCGIPTI